MVAFFTFYAAPTSGQTERRTALFLHRQFLLLDLDYVEVTAIYGTKYWCGHILSLLEVRNFECKHRCLIDESVTIEIFCSIRRLQAAVHAY